MTRVFFFNSKESYLIKFYSLRRSLTDYIPAAVRKVNDVRNFFKGGKVMSYNSICIRHVWIL